VTLLQPELVAQLAAAFPDGVAWRNVADGSCLTLRDWHRRSNRMAHGLASHGIGRGDRVVLLVGPDDPLNWLVSYMGIHKAAAVAVPLSTRLGGGELSRIVRHASPSMVLCSDAHPDLSSLVPAVAAIGGGGTLSWDDVLPADESDPATPVAPDDIADIVYTSGTTGEPKGVVVRHENLSTTDRVPEVWSGLGFLTSSPFTTTSGSLLVCGPMRGGLTGWSLPRFGPERWIEVVETERPVAAFLVPAMVELLVASPHFETADLTSLVVVNIGSAPIAAATLRLFGAGLGGAEVLCGYGMTEFGAVTAVPMGDRGAHLGSVGLPLPGVQVRILGEDGSPRPTGEVGQVAIRGTRRARTYLDEPDASGDTRVDGWLLSGDLGSLDADGHLWIVGRQKELIIRGGHNVVPGEVESAFFEHPSVREAAVAGVPHDVLGEDVVAWVVLRDDVTQETLRKFLLTRLADYKVPRRINVLSALPRNESGKVLKGRLVADETRSAS
jgi:acyl-CoA synthetase (AMP-forming)/AMP-acid ligase II